MLQITCYKYCLHRSGIPISIGRNMKSAIWNMESGIWNMNHPPQFSRSKPSMAQVFHPELSTGENNDNSLKLREYLLVMTWLVPSLPISGNVAQVRPYQVCIVEKLTGKSLVLPVPGIGTGRLAPEYRDLCHLTQAEPRLIARLMTGSTLPTPILPLQTPVPDHLSNVFRWNIFTGIRVGNNAGYY